MTLLAAGAAVALQGEADGPTSGLQGFIEGPAFLPIEATLEDLAAEFELLGDWEERYRHVIDLGRTLEPLAGSERSDANKVRGCASQVWLVTEPQADGSLKFRGDSDAHIVRGLIAILLRLFSGRRPDDILGFDAKAAFQRLGLTGALSAQRSNGLFAMTERIRRDASQPRVGAA